MSTQTSPIPRPSPARVLSSGWVQGGLALIAVAVAPYLVSKGFSNQWLNILLFVEIYLILSLGLNLVVGFTGLLDLGYVIFMATGAVVAVWLCGLRRDETGFDWPIGNTGDVAGELVFGFDGAIVPILLICGAVCAVVGVLRGIPTLRVRGDYFAIVTLGFAEIFFETALWDESKVVNFSRLTGGAFGAKLRSTDRPTLLGEKLFWDTPQFYFLVLAAVVVAFVVSHHVNRSRTGRALAAIRLDETAARACGVNVSRYKLVAFALSGFLGGVGGGLFALWTGTVSVKNLDVWQSIMILSCVVLGGMGSIRGVAVGTVILMPLGELLKERLGNFLDSTGLSRLGAVGRFLETHLGDVAIPPEARFLVYGFVLIVVMRYRPQGLLPPVRRGVPLTETEREDHCQGPCDLYSLGAARGGEGAP